jgi:hypothetical protein
MTAVRWPTKTSTTATTTTIPPKRNKSQRAKVIEAQATTSTRSNYKLQIRGLLALLVVGEAAVGEEGRGPREAVSHPEISQFQDVNRKNN